MQWRGGGQFLCRVFSFWSLGCRFDWSLLAGNVASDSMASRHRVPVYHSPSFWFCLFDIFQREVFLGAYITSFHAWRIDGISRIVVNVNEGYHRDSWEVWLLAYLIRCINFLPCYHGVAFWDFGCCSYLAACGLADRPTCWSVCTFVMESGRS